MAWYLAPSLQVLRTEVNTRWPQRDRASDGTIGDEAHQGTDSDHNPNARESVDAWDMDKDGVSVSEVIAAFQRHPSAHYWIWDRQIADKDSNWRRQGYNGTNPHTQHVHFSIRQSATAEQNRQPWGLLEETNMAFMDDEGFQALAYSIEALKDFRTTVRLGPNAGQPFQTVVKVTETLNRLSTLEAKMNTALANLATLNGKDFVDEEAIAETVLNGLRDRSTEDVVALLQGIFSAEQLAAIKTAL